MHPSLEGAKLRGSSHGFALTLATPTRAQDIDLGLSPYRGPFYKSPEERQPEVLEDIERHLRRQEQRGRLREEREAWEALEDDEDD